MRPFHLAFPVTDLKSTKSFYVDILKCEVGRSSDAWIDFNMFGHQVVAHLVDENNHPASNSVDGDEVPASHFGVVLTMSQWKELKNHFKYLENIFSNKNKGNKTKFWEDLFALMDEE